MKIDWLLFFEKIGIIKINNPREFKIQNSILNKKFENRRL
ncbi:hypothetical protein SAMN05880573_104114 [Chryseobacterium sp. RU33C]|nr:hypothetical protein SAMN05880573_104114 [Chryseobacterium sp. RU33C]